MLLLVLLHLVRLHLYVVGVGARKGGGELRREVAHVVLHGVGAGATPETVGVGLERDDVDGGAHVGVLGVGVVSVGVGRGTHEAGGPKAPCQPS